VLNRTVGASNINSFVDRFVHDFGQTQFHCEKSGDTHNKGLAIAGVQWLMEVFCFYFTFVLADRLVLLNARHRQAPKRWNNGGCSALARRSVLPSVCLPMASDRSRNGLSAPALM
jgi:hypothetical protein